MDKNLMPLCITCYSIIKFIIDKTGQEYGISHFQKFKLFIRILHINKGLDSLRLRQHLLLVREILGIPRSLKGDVVECGCYNGASTVSLSLACGLTNRMLFVCDSFEGLPKARQDEQLTVFKYSNRYYSWQEGDFASKGGLDKVKENIRKFGKLDACQFVKGYFKDTLKNIGTDSIVLIFEDAILVSSIEDCLRYLWPKLQEKCKFFCHEPWSLEVVSLFFDRQWWRRELDTTPPGFFGSFSGVIPGIGFAKKIDFEKIKKQGERIFLW